MNVSDYLYYDESVKSRLRWKVDMYSGNTLNHICKYAGTEAGSYDKTRNYWKVQVRGTQLLAHRVIWELLNGDIPAGMVIDHIDGDGSNNCPSNIRCVTTKHNSRNTKRYSHNTSGKTGVRFKNIGGLLYALGYCRNHITGKSIEKCFSVNKYGLLPAFSMAARFRGSMIEVLNNDGAGYTDRHLTH